MKAFISYLAVLFFTASVSGLAFAQAPSFEGTWSGVFSSQAYGQRCTYNVTKSVIANNQIHWKAVRTKCSHFACGQCPEKESFTQSVTANTKKKTITFSTSKNNDQDHLVTLTLDPSGNKLSGEGNMKDHNASYKINLAKDK